MGKDDNGPEWGRHVFTKADPSDSYARKRKARKAVKKTPRPESYGVGAPPPMKRKAEEREPPVQNVKRKIKVMALNSETPSVPLIEQRLRKYGEPPSKVAIASILKEFETTLDLLIEKGIVTPRALRAYRNRE